MVLKGEYRHYVQIYAATRTTDNQGGYTSTWTSAGYEWMKVTPLSESRSLDRGGIKYVKAIECYANKYSSLYTLTEANRLYWNSEYYTIHSIVPSGKLDEIRIIAYA